MWRRVIRRRRPARSLSSYHNVASFRTCGIGCGSHADLVCLWVGLHHLALRTAQQRGRGSHHHDQQVREGGRGALSGAATNAAARAAGGGGADGGGEALARALSAVQVSSPSDIVTEHVHMPSSIHHAPSRPFALVARGFPCALHYLLRQHTNTPWAVAPLPALPGAVNGRSRRWTRLDRLPFFELSIPPEKRPFE